MVPGATTGPPVSSLDGAPAQPLIALASAYPGGVELERLVSHMGVGFMVGEQVLEGFAGRRLIEYRRATPYGGGSDVWALTKLGRDYCVENQLNKPLRVVDCIIVFMDRDVDFW